MCTFLLCKTIKYTAVQQQQKKINEFKLLYSHCEVCGGTCSIPEKNQMNISQSHFCYSHSTNRKGSFTWQNLFPTKHDFPPGGRASHELSTNQLYWMITFFVQRMFMVWLQLFSNLSTFIPSAGDHYSSHFRCHWTKPSSADGNKHNFGFRFYLNSLEKIKKKSRKSS